MGLFKRLKGRAEAAPSTPKDVPLADLGRLEGVEAETDRALVVRLTSKLREWDVPDEGDEDIWWRGYDLHDENGRGWTWHDPALSRADIIIAKIAGVQHHTGMTIAGVGPGRPLRLVPEPENPYDPNAVAIWDVAGQEQIGYLPRDVAAHVSKKLRAGNQLGAVCIAELIKKPGDVRAGLRVLVAPPGLVEGWPSA